MDRVIYRIISVFFAFAIAHCVNAQDEIDDFDYNFIESYASTPAEYVIVNVSGTGSVNFENPERINITSYGYTVTKTLKIGTYKVPGQGPLMKFTTTCDAKVTTSGKQSFDVSAGSIQFILITNEYAPVMDIKFAN